MHEPAVNWTGLNPLIEAISSGYQFVGLGASWSRRAAFGRPTFLSVPVPAPEQMQSGEAHHQGTHWAGNKVPPTVRYAPGIHLVGL
jgi:hypothetical protein